MAYIPGMPSSDYNKYQESKKNQSKSSGSSSSSKKQNTSSNSSASTKTSVPGMPSSVPVSVQQSAQKSYNNRSSSSSSSSSSNSYDTTKTSVPGMPSYVPGSYQQAAQQSYETRRKTNEDYINSLKGDSVSTLMKNTNTAQIVNSIHNRITSSDSALIGSTFKKVTEYNPNRIYEVLPTADRKRIVDNINNMQYYARKFSKNRLAKDVYDLVQVHDAEYKQRTIQEMQNNKFWNADDVQYVTYATSADYYRMNKQGFQTVYIEDGCGSLDNKAGIYTIGRDRLAGLPKDVSTVLVDKDGNWRYIANSGSRASYVEDLRNKQDALTRIYEDKLNKAYSREEFINLKCEQLEKQIKWYDKIANKSRKQEDIDKLQKAIEQYSEFSQYSVASRKDIANICSEWASRYNIFENASRKYTKWTVEDEARYEHLKEAIDRSGGINISSSHISGIGDSKVAEKMAAGYKADKQNNDSALLAEYLELKKRREEEGYLPVFIDMDTINKMKKDEESMKKIVDEYNIWDSATIHTENGEDFGNYAKRLLFRDILDPATDEEKKQNEQQMTEQVNWGLTFGNYKWDYFKEDLKGMAVALYKATIAPWVAASKDKERAQQAYKEAEEKLHADNLTDEERNFIYQQQQKYRESELNAYKQARSVMFNNVVSNLSVFDIASVQSTFVAWRMAAHPERYSNDPKFKKMQEAYKKVYGTDYRGAIDAGNMAHAMLNVKLGRVSGDAGDDYIYLDGSDLRHESGEKYGFWASMGVGLGTDIGAIVGLAKTAVSSAIKHGGAKVLVKSASDSLMQSLTRAGVTQEVAEEFVKSKAFRNALNKDLRSALGKYAKEGGLTIEADMRNILKQRADDFRFMFESTDPKAIREGVDGIIHGIDETRYAKFMRSAEETFASIADNAERSFLLNRCTVIANTLGDVDALLDGVQSKLFKVSCPVAGATTAIIKGNKWIKSLRNIAAADEQLLHKMAATQNILEAEIAEMDWTSCLEGARFQKIHDTIVDSFSWGAMDDIKHRLHYGEEFDNTIRRFSDYQDGMMQGVANSYIDNVMNKLRTTISDGDVDALEKLAQQHNFETFSDMYSVIKENLGLMTKYSPDAQGIIDSFDNFYNTAVVKNNLKNIKKYVEHANDHLYGMKNAVGENLSILSIKNAAENPDFVQSTARMLSDEIHSFLYTADADMMLFTDAADNLCTIHEAGVKAMDALDSIASGSMKDLDFKDAIESLKEYTTEIQDVYIKNLNDWEANAMQDALGVQHYLDDITEIVPDHAGNMETIETVNTKLMEYFEKRGIAVTADDISKVLKQDMRDFEKMSIAECQSVIYRITENKGSNAIAQIRDANLKTITDALTDCNSQFNKNLTFMRSRLDEAADKRVGDAIANACAIENTRIISDVLKEGGVDSTMHMAIIDALSGNSNAINRIVQTYSPDVATSKIRDFVINEVKKQVALHNGTYRTFRELGADTVDVEANVRVIEQQLDEFVEPKEEYLDICVSMVRPTDHGAPKDIAFHMRGSTDAPKVLRKDSAFTVYDDTFASRTYGKTASQLTQDYEALGLSGGLTGSEWQKQLKAYIDQQKQIALEQNKTLRFIGFNSSDAITGNNKYLSDVLRSCGVNANMSSAIDLADAMRRKAGEYVFDPAQIEALNRGIRTAVDSARARSISLGVSASIAYDSKYTCADMLKGVLDNHTFNDETIDSAAQYIREAIDTTIKGIGTGEYNKTGLAMGAYLDATAFAQIIEDAGESAIHANGDLMKIISECTVRGDAQLGMHKIIETAMDNEWIDYSRLDPAHFSTMASREKVHETILQINKINSGLHRTDLITEADRKGLQYIYGELVSHIPVHSHGYFMTKLFKVEDITTQQLYSVNKWLLDQAQRTMDADKYDAMLSILFFNAQQQASYLSDVGYRFIRDNIIDYSDDTVDAFLVKYLDNSEEGYRFATALNEIADLEKSSHNIKNYQDLVENIFTENNVHGVQDRLLVMQMAEVHRPIIAFQDELKEIYEKAYYAATKELKESAPYSSDLINRVATERGVEAMKQSILEFGDEVRKDSVQAVVDLDADAMKAHLVRNCCGGLVIDPTAKCVEGLDLPVLFERWKKYGLAVDTVTVSENLVQERKLFRVYMPELNNMNPDDIFAKYDHARIHFKNAASDQFDNAMRNASFGASDMTLSNAEHIDKFRELFFGDGKGTIVDLNKNFKSWTNELYSCNMWTDMDIKQLVNPYYTDNALNNLAQNTHQLRNNISALHDLGSIVNNKYMKTDYILKQSGVYSTAIPLWEQREKIVQQITSQKQKLCKISVDSHNRLKVIDYTPVLAKKSTNNDFFKDILENTVMLDDGMYTQLSDWTKRTTMALKFQASDAPEWLVSAYNIYKKTIRNGTITWYLYGNRGTGVRNAVDSSTKGLNEVAQYDQDIATYARKYVDAIKDTQEYSNIYRQIEIDKGTVNRETITKFFGDDIEAMNKFNILYGYEHTCGGDSILTEVSLKKTRQESAKHFIDEAAGIDAKKAEAIRSTFDKVYGSIKYYGLNNAQIAEHMTAIHDDCMRSLRKKYTSNMFTDEQLDYISRKFWDYKPTVSTWGDKMSQFPLLNYNKKFFNNAETRARLAVYQTFLEGGSSEYEAMQHVKATQFHYAGIGKVEDFMPFTQYKLYNAAYWFDHAGSHAIKTMWRAGQYNSDGYMTNQEISAMITKYNQKNYYIYDEGADQDYDEFYDRNRTLAAHILFDGVDSYLGVPREFNIGNLDLNGTHYLKLGNSFIEEIDMVTSFAIGVTAMATSLFDHVTTPQKYSDKLRSVYESFKYSPIYDSFYSPWKSYMDLIAFAYDNKRTGKLNSSDIWEYYEQFMANKGTHSEAIAALPVVGAILSNMVGRWKSFDLNLGQLAALITDPDAQSEMFEYVRDLLCDTAGMLIPSVVGTKIEPEGFSKQTYAARLSKNYLVENPTTYFDILGRLQNEMGFDKEQADEIWASMKTGWELGDYKSKLDYYYIAKELFSRGFTEDEIVNLFKQQNLPNIENKRFLAMTNALPNFLKYDKEMRRQVIAYYKALGYSTDAAWAKLISNPALIYNGQLIQLTRTGVAVVTQQHDKLYWALHKTEPWDDSDWNAYWATLRELGFYYPKGKWKETRDYLVRAGYSYNEARDMLLHGYMLDNNGRLVDVQGQARKRVFSYQTLKGAEWDAYWATVPDYTKYEKGAFGRTMKALKKMGYNDAQARALIQQGIYVGKDGKMMNVTGMQRPVLGYPNFNAYYQSIPEYCRYEKGAFKRTYAALKQLGFNYDTSLTLIQQGAYLMDISAAPQLAAALVAQHSVTAAVTKNIVVNNITTLLQKYGGTIINDAAGKPHILIDCSGLTRPRKSFGYTRRGYGRRGGRGYSGGGRRWTNYTRKPKVKYSHFYLRQPFVHGNNVSSYNGFTNFSGKAPGKITKPYTTKRYVSTYSMQNFLNGSSYGMRKVYKIDMRQYKSGALSTKSAYPAAYRNIAVSYRRNLYKDLYAKYGASRMQMRANQAGYSNASIVRLRRNEIQNRERYAERHDRKADEKVRTRATR